MYFNFSAVIPEEINPCQPSPCGPYSECREINNAAACSCIPNYIGSPPNCRPECVTNSQCSRTEACIQEKCVDPCVGLCGINAECKVVNHSPYCVCPSGYEGDAFDRCLPIPSSKLIT